MSTKIQTTISIPRVLYIAWKKEFYQKGDTSTGVAILMMECLSNEELMKMVKNRITMGRTIKDDTQPTPFDEIEKEIAEDISKGLGKAILEEMENGN